MGIEPEAPVLPVQRETGLGWRKLQRWGGVGALVALGTAELTGFEPFLLILMVPILIGLFLLRRSSRVGVVWLGAVSLILLGLNAPFLLQVFSYPESPPDFIPPIAFITGALVSVIATIPAFRQGKGAIVRSTTARVIGIIALVLVVAAAGVSLAASTGVESEAAKPGDIEVRTEDFVFYPKQLDAESGEISVHIKNEDSGLHTFTIDGLGVDVAIPGGKERRVTFRAEPGTYRFYCRPHAPDMDGKLAVS